MSTNVALKGLTLNQRMFLDALAGEARGDLHAAKKLSGYSDTTSLSDIVRPIKDYVIDVTRTILANHGPKAAFGLIDVMESPATVGAANKVKASSEILNRIGVVPPTNEAPQTQKGAVFILPAKNIDSIKITHNEVTIDMVDDTLVTETKIIDVINDEDEADIDYPDEMPEQLDSIPQIA